MKMSEVYEEVKELGKLAYEADDLMSQDTLFEMQDKLAALMLHLAVAAHKEKDLVENFPYLYTMEK